MNNNSVKKKKKTCSGCVAIKLMCRTHRQFFPLLCIVILLCITYAAEAKQPSAASDSSFNGTVEEFLAAAERLRNSGDFAPAKKVLDAALDQTRQHQDKALSAKVYGALGNLYVATGPQHIAQNFLTRAEALARETGQAELIAGSLINLANFFTFQQQFEQAQDAFNRSLEFAKKSNNRVLTAKSLANAARFSALARQFNSSEQTLKQAMLAVNSITNQSIKHKLLLNLASTYIELMESATQTTTIYAVDSYPLLLKAVTHYQAAKDQEGVSLAKGLLGRIYELSARHQEALQLTQQALFAAQLKGNKYLLYRWYWQQARLFQQLKKTDLAISSYQHALGLLDSLRFQLLVSYRPAGSAFVEMIAPVYSQYIELLIEQNSNRVDSSQYAANLTLVRDTIESLKAAEIRDYFGDACVDALKAKQKPLWKTSTRAVIVYPVLMEDSSIMLMDFPDGRLHMHRIPMPLDELSGLVRQFRIFLEKRTTNEYRIPGKQLYDLLITPIVKAINSNEIDTLVFVPDGALFSIPLGALYDGKQHLIEQFATAITPGIQLVDPSPLSNQKIKPLLGGLSESVDDYPPLIYVEEELDFINKLYGGNLLLNDQFKPALLEASLSDPDINLLHISTHGFLGNSVDNSYLLTYDGKISINSLADFVGRFKFREQPLELLVLSACETAQGDSRSALGLSGIAVRAGARSAIGSLWKVNDGATTQLMTEFYQQFQQPGISRAAALQQAKISVMQNLQYRHPGYWSAFLLINNWL